MCVTPLTPSWTNPTPNPSASPWGAPENFIFGGQKLMQLLLRAVKQAGAPALPVAAQNGRAG